MTYQSPNMTDDIDETIDKFGQHIDMQLSLNNFAFSLTSSITNHFSMSIYQLLIQ